VAEDADEAIKVAKDVGYPVLVRPSYVLGGQGMKIVINDEELEKAVIELLGDLPGNRCLIDHFLDRAEEAEIDLICDHDNEVHIIGMMEHIEPAGIHSGDSSAVLPPFSLSETVKKQMETYAIQLAKNMNIRGLLNIQFAIKNEKVYVIEANPRASRTVPFVSKALGITLAKAAALVMVGNSIAQLRVEGHLPALDGTYIPANSPIAVKEAVLPFKRFATPDGRYVDSLLGPEMRSTGEVMGIDVNFPKAFAKSQAAAGSSLPTSGRIFISVADRDKPQMLLPVRRLEQLGYEILATAGTAQILQRHGIKAKEVRKHSQGSSATEGPTIVELITAGEVDVVVNTPTGSSARKDGYEIRAATTAADKPIFTTLAQLSCAIGSFEAVIAGPFEVKSLQEHAADRKAALGV
jgi:carbamoyl-phosphate synthase large subunit